MTAPGTRRSVRTTTGETTVTLVRSRPSGVLAAALAALAVWVLAVPVLGVDLFVVPVGGTLQEVAPVAVAAGPVVAGLAGWALLALLERRARHPHRTWRVVALVVLALSLATPLAGGVGAAATGVLVLMHLVAGGVLIALLPR